MRKIMIKSLACLMAMSLLCLVGCTTKTAQNPCHKKVCPVKVHPQPAKHVVRYAK